MHNNIFRTDCGDEVRALRYTGRDELDGRVQEALGVMQDIKEGLEPVQESTENVQDIKETLDAVQDTTNDMQGGRTELGDDMEKVNDVYVLTL
ncbi:hypothetical protein EUX98_g4976 [Antrodiella citrinella]|uniref:Uncharacterized protein n=1 Tax=Antrodiella citrinella TaxID=2447956 RepID=A0A4S4MSN9_9APHY|nr:hypothetical protein EUX98_g4976 [Antrodiella citrinella]